MIFAPTRSNTERVLEQLEAYFMSLGFGQTVRNRHRAGATRSHDRV